MVVHNRANDNCPSFSPFLAGLIALGFIHDASAETRRGLIVALEHRCAAYDKKRDYPYPQSVEQDIVRALGAVYGPYTGTCFASTTDSTNTLERNQW